MNTKFLVLLAIASVAYGQEMTNQLTGEQSAAEEAFQQPMSGQDVRSNDNKQQIIVIEEHKKVPQKPHHDSVQAFIVQKPQPQKEVIFSAPVHSKPTHQQVEVIKVVEDHHKHPQPHPQNVQIIKVPVHEEHPHPHPPHVSHHRKCEMLSRKGECTSIPNFFSCIRDGGVLAPDIGDCSFTQACCIRNFFGQ